MANLYKGHPQPDPNERLAQIRIFLADEDYYRTLDFTKKLAKIENYVKFLGRNEYECDKQLLKGVNEMIFAHRELIRKATQPPSTSYFFTRYNHNNRLLNLVKDGRRRATLARVRAPRLPHELLPGPALHKCIEENERPSSPDPFLYTRQLAAIRHKQDVEAKRILDQEQSAVLRKLVPTNFNGPFTLLFNIDRRNIWKRQNQLLNTLKKLNDAATLAPRPFIQEIITTITHPIKGSSLLDRTEALDSIRGCWGNKDIEQLLILAQPSWSSASKRAREDLFGNDGKLQSELLAQLVKQFDSVVWSSPDSHIALADVYQHMNEEAKLDGFNLATPEIEALLLRLNEVGFIRYDVSSRTIRQAVLDQHPENFTNSDIVPLDSYRLAARRLGNGIENLEKILQTKKEYKITTLTRNTSPIPLLKQKIETRFPLPIPTSVPSKALEVPLTKEQLAGLLQQQILHEHNHNWDDRTPDFQQLWSFASMRKETRNFFALGRWPPELQSRKRMNEIMDSGPAPASPKQSLKVDSLIRKENETIYIGETVFPFGETRYQAALLSQEIELRRPGGPIQQRRRSDPFALAPIPETENKALLDYAQRLGLLARKRKLSADYTIPEEKLPPAEFKPETIGGVRILVAEAPHPKHGRYIMSTADQIHQNGGKYEEADYLKPGKQLGWRSQWQPGWVSSEHVVDPVPRDAHVGNLRRTTSVSKSVLESESESESEMESESESKIEAEQVISLTKGKGA